MGAARGPAGESTFRRAFALAAPMCSIGLSVPALDQGRAGRQAGWSSRSTADRRGAKSGNGKAPHLVAALAHGIGAVLGQVAVDEKSNEIPAVRELLKAFADLAGAVLTIDAMHTQHDTALLSLGRRADCVMTVKARMHPVPAAQEAAPGEHPGRSSGAADHGWRAAARRSWRSPPADRVRRCRPGRASAPHGHAEREEDRRGRFWRDHQRPQREPGDPGRPGSAAAALDEQAPRPSATSLTRKIRPWARMDHLRVLAFLRSLAISIPLDGHTNIAAATASRPRPSRRRPATSAVGPARTLTRSTVTAVPATMQRDDQGEHPPQMMTAALHASDEWPAAPVPVTFPPATPTVRQSSAGDKAGDGSDQWRS